MYLNLPLPIDAREVFGEFYSSPNAIERLDKEFAKKFKEMRERVVLAIKSNSNLNPPIRDDFELELFRFVLREYNVEPNTEHSVASILKRSKQETQIDTLPSYYKTKMVELKYCNRKAVDNIKIPYREEFYSKVQNISGCLNSDFNFHSSMRELQAVKECIERFVNFIGKIGELEAESYMPGEPEAYRERFISPVYGDNGERIYPPEENLFSGLYVAKRFDQVLDVCLTAYIKISSQELDDPAGRRRMTIELIRNTVQEVVIAFGLLSDEPNITSMAQRVIDSNGMPSTTDIFGLYAESFSILYEREIWKSFDEDKKSILQTLVGGDILGEATRRQIVFKEKAIEDRDMSLKLWFCPTRGVFMDLAGYICDTCWTSMIEIAKNYPNFVFVPFLYQKGKGPVQIGGGALLAETTNENGEKVMVVVAFNPTEGFVNTIKVEDLWNEFIEYLYETGERSDEKFTGGVLTTWQDIPNLITSNRQHVHFFLGDKFGEQVESGTSFERRAKTVGLANDEDTKFYGMNLNGRCVFAHRPSEEEKDDAVR